MTAIAKLFKRKPVLFVFLLIALLALLAWYTRYSGAPVVATAQVVRGTAVEAVYATGTVEPVYWAKLSALASGIVTSISKDEGDSVLTGDVMARLDDVEQKARVEKLFARLRYLQAELKRQRQLSKSDFASRKELENTQSEHDQVQAEIQEASKQLANAEVLAPMEGAVLRRLVEQGEYAKAGDALFWVGKPKPLQVLAEIDEEDIAKVTLRQKAFIKADAFPDMAIQGVVSKLIPKGDPVNKIFLAEITVPDEADLRIGMTTEVNIVVTEKPGVLLVPAAAYVNGKVWVYKSGRAVQQQVKPGIIGENMVEVQEGLEESSIVLLPEADELKDGQRVRTK